MVSSREVPPFVPAAEPKAEHMVVLTVRVAPKTRDALRRFLRHDDALRYGSVSHIVQTAIDEFLTRNK